MFKYSCTEYGLSTILSSRNDRRSMLQLLVILAVLFICNGQNVWPVDDLRTLPATVDDDAVESQVFICGIVPNTINYTASWTTPTGTTVDANEAGVVVRAENSKYMVINGDILTTFPQGSILSVMKLHYSDAGNYTCSITFTDSGTIETAVFQLYLNVFVRIIGLNHLTVMSGDAVSITCEMSGYIHEDSAFVWTKENERLANSDRRNITFADGDPMRGQRGDASLSHSRLSTLSLLNIRKSDAGVYTCLVAGTKQEATIQLIVIVEEITHESTTTLTTTPQSTTSCSSSNTITAVITVLVTTLLCTATFTLLQIIICKCQCQFLKKRLFPAKSTAKNDPLYSEVRRHNTENLKENDCRLQSSKRLC